MSPLRCVSRNAHLVILTFIAIIIAPVIGLQIYTSGPERPVSVGTEALLQCSYSPYVHVDIKWAKKQPGGRMKTVMTKSYGSVVNGVGFDRMSFQPSSQASMIIRSVQLNDAGTYVCTITEPGIDPLMGEVRLQVTQNAVGGPPQRPTRPPNARPTYPRINVRTVNVRPGGAGGTGTGGRGTGGTGAGGRGTGGTGGTGGRGTGGTGTGGTGGRNPGTGGRNPGTGNFNPGTGNFNPGTGNTNPGTGNFNPGTGNFNPGTGNTNPGTGNFNPGTGNFNPGTGNTNPGTGNFNPGTGNANPGTGNFNPGTGNHNPGTGNFNPGTGNFGPGTGNHNPGTGNFNPGTGNFDPGNGGFGPGTGGMRTRRPIATRRFGPGFTHGMYDNKDPINPTDPYSRRPFHHDSLGVCVRPVVLLVTVMVILGGALL